MKRILPQNYRYIPARAKRKWGGFFVKCKKNVSSHKKTYLMAVFCLEVIFLLGLLATNLFLFNKYMFLKEQRALALKELVSWEKEIAKYPKYPEAYYNAALYAEAVGDREKALEYVSQSLLLNPNFEASKKLQERLMQ